MYSLASKGLERRFIHWKEGSEKSHFIGVFTWMHKNNGQGVLKAKISLLLTKLYAWGETTHLDPQLRIYDQIILGGYFPQSPFFYPHIYIFLNHNKIKSNTADCKKMCFYLKPNFYADLCLQYKHIFYTQSHEHKFSVLNWQTLVYAMFGYFGEKVIEGRETFIPELDLLIQNYSGVHYLFSDSPAYRSTVEIKTTFIFLSLISPS